MSDAPVFAVADTTTSSVLAAGRKDHQPKRIMLSIINTSSARLYILLGTGTASSTNHTTSIGQNGFYELPIRADSTVYQGDIYGVWASDPGDGSALITEEA